MFDAELRRAIAERRLIQLSYKGKLRVVEPHDYGVYKGAVRLFVYQIRGASTTQGRQAADGSCSTPTRSPAASC